MQGELESLFNSLLSGLHPDTGEPAPIPGFAAFFTGNGLECSNRDALSPALYHRVLSIFLSRLQIEDMMVLMENVNEQHGASYEKEDLRILAQCLIEASARDPLISLRLLTMHGDRFLPLLTAGETPPGSDYAGAAIFGRNIPAAATDSSRETPTPGDTPRK